MEQAVSAENLARALRTVVRNRGGAGIDGMSVNELEGHLERHREKIVGKLLAGRWTPSPVKRVEIPKPGGGVRKLGIPTVVDRLIQQALLQVLTPIFDPTFSEWSYGFREGRSAHDAVRAAQGYVREGKSWVVDIDLEKFFDQLNHDILMVRIGKTIRDKRVLRLIGRYLRAGALVEGKREPSRAGAPQGGPLSPLLANIYLDPLDRELERRGLRFCRYADDCNQHLCGQRGGGGAGGGVDLRLDREASAIEGQPRQERDGTALGAQVSGVPAGPQGSDHTSAGESVEVQDEGPRVVAQRPIADEHRVAGSVGGMAARLVGVLPAGRAARRVVWAGGLDTETYPEVFLAAVA